MNDKMKLFRFHTQLNHGQDWTKYDVLAPTMVEAMKIAEAAIVKNDRITGKKEQFQGCTTAPKRVDIVGVETLSARVDEVAMGWAERARTGLWERAQQRQRRETLAHNLLPRLILHQALHLGVALVLFPIRLTRHLWRRYAAEKGELTQDRG